MYHIHVCRIESDSSAPLATLNMEDTEQLSSLIYEVLSMSTLAHFQHQYVTFLCSSLPTSKIVSETTFRYSTLEYEYHILIA